MNRRERIFGGSASAVWVVGCGLVLVGDILLRVRGGERWSVCWWRERLTDIIENMEGVSESTSVEVPITFTYS